MSTKHTGGTWLVDGLEIRTNNYIIARMSDWVAKFREEQNANAQLFSAAPELLEALKAILDTTAFAHDGPETEVHQRALSAIRKAGGAL